MCGKYGLNLRMTLAEYRGINIKVSSKELRRQAWQIPEANGAFFAGTHQDDKEKLQVDCPEAAAVIAKANAVMGKLWLNKAKPKKEGFFPEVLVIFKRKILAKHYGGSHDR